MKRLIARFQNSSRLEAMLRSSTRDQERLGIRTFDDVNRAIHTEAFPVLIKNCEEDYARRLESIVRRMLRNKGRVRLICLAGPSCSGKTTTSLKLADGLAQQGIKAVPLAMDNYFKNREETPRDASGDYDFEDVAALDTHLLNAHIRDLIAGQEVLPPVYDFKTGRQRPGTKPLRLGSDEILVMEGIHALNRALTSGVGRDKKFLLYVTAMTRLKNHKNHFLHSTDNRFIRRIVRDSLFRGYGARETIERWPSVMRGEKKNIFPFQEEADIIFNSALAYEYPVLKQFAFDLLVEINRRNEVFLEARKLLSVLNYFAFPDEEAIQSIPSDSVLREFIGGSTYHY